MDDKIYIPTDIDGFVKCKCPSCEEVFMIHENDLMDFSWCPHCGLQHDCYYDDEIRELGLRKANNMIADLFNDFSDRLVKSTKGNNYLKFKKGKKIEKEEEIPVSPPIVDAELIKYNCCDKNAKISSILRFEGGYCPFCGEITNGI